MTALSATPDAVSIGAPATFTDATWSEVWPEPDPDAGDGSEYAEDTDGPGPGTSDPSVLEPHDEEG